MRRLTLLLIFCAIALAACGPSPASPAASSTANQTATGSAAGLLGAAPGSGSTPGPVATASPAASLAAGWTVFTPTDGSFHVALPGVPTTRSESTQTTLGTMSVTDYAVLGADGSPTYMVAQGRLPTNAFGKFTAGDIDTFLAATIGGYASSASGITSKQAQITFLGYAARTATITAGKSVQELLAFVAGDNLYILDVAHAPTAAVTPDQFFGSFRLP